MRLGNTMTQAQLREVWESTIPDEELNAIADCNGKTSDDLSATDHRGNQH